MPQRHYPPAYLRYLKARLWNLARPGFWGTAIFLSVVGLVIKEYWTYPDFLTNKQENQVAKKSASSLTAEDRAIAADIDNLPLLFNDSVSTVPTTPQNNQAKNSRSILEALNSQNRNTTDTTKSDAKTVDPAPNKVENPFLAQAENLLRFGTIQDSSKLLGVNTSTQTFSQQSVGQNSLDLGLNYRPNVRQNSVPENPLQTALNQSTNQNSPSLNSATSTQVNSLGSSIQPTNSLSSQNITPNTPTGNNGINSSYPGLGYTRSGLTNQAQNVNPNTGYIQPGIVNQLQPPISGVGYTIQQGQTNLLPPNNVTGVSNIQPVPVNQLQNPIPSTGYTQPSLTNQPQNLTSTTGYVQQGQNYQPQSFYPNRYDRRLSNYVNRVRSTNGGNDVYGTQALPTQQTLVAPAPTTVPYYNQIPTQGNVTNPVIPTTQVPQYNSYPGQFPRQ